MELRHLRYFITVAEELHFGRAAERLFMAQPPLSQQIQQMEREMGVLLFERTNRRVRLTDAGAVFLTDARDILRRLEEATFHARQVALGEEGWFGIGFVGSATYDVLPTILRRFREQHPSIELVLHELLWSEQGQALREKRIHVGFTRFPLDKEGLILETVAQEPLIIALPATHFLAKMETIPLSALANEPFILYPRQRESGYAQYVVRLCLEAGFSPRVIQEAGELQTAVSLVAAGIGVTLVPSPVRNLRRDGVVYRSLAEPAPTIALTLAYRTDDTSLLLARFLDIARETVSESSEPVPT